MVNVIHKRDGKLEAKYLKYANLCLYADLRGAEFHLPLMLIYNLCM